MAAVNWLGSLPGHIQYGDFLFGPGTRWRWDELQGWEDTPAIDSGTVLRSTQHGAWPGVFLAQSRTVTISMVIKSEPGEMNATVRQLAAATPIDLEDEIPLVIQLDEEAPLLLYARCDRRAINVARSNRTGLTRGALQFVASDPRKYSLLEYSTTTELPLPEDGLSFPLEFPLDWGSIGSTGNMECVNSGDAPTHPLIEIHGPCDTPSITNINTGDQLEYDLALSDADVLYVDTGQGTVTLNGTTANRLYTATTQSVPEATFVLPPGSTALAFRSDDSPPDPAAFAKVTWRSAFW